MRTCIYCRGTGPDLKFNREHVMCQAFGMFADNLVLADEVCWDCNDAMGKEVETPGTRGSIEGVHRFKTGKLRSAESFLKTPGRRVSYEIAERGWEGVRAYHVASDDGRDVRVMFRPQVIVDFKDGRQKAFLLVDLTAAEMLKDTSTFRLYADSDEEVAALVDALERLGIRPVWKGAIEMPPSSDGRAEVKVSAVYDDVVRRLVAKIAFNYLASQTGAAFVLKDEFDPIRRFIRYGEGRGSGFVTPKNTPLLFEEQNAGSWSITEDHLVAIGRSAMGGLDGHVSLFNMVHNEIVLSRRNPEVIQLGVIPSGRRFSWTTGTITSLLGWDDDNLVQPAEVLRARRR